MFKMNFNQFQMNLFVKDALCFIGEFDNIDVKSFVNDYGKLECTVKYMKFINGNYQECIMAINNNNYLSLLKYGIELKGYNLNSLKIKTKDGKIKCKCMLDVVSEDLHLKKVSK